MSDKWPIYPDRKLYVCEKCDLRWQHSGRIEFLKNAKFSICPWCGRVVE